MIKVVWCRNWRYVYRPDDSKERDHLSLTTSAVFAVMRTKTSWNCMFRYIVKEQEWGCWKREWKRAHLLQWFFKFCMILCSHVRSLNRQEALRQWIHNYIYVCKLAVVRCLGVTRELLRMEKSWGMFSVEKSKDGCIM